eukprot:m.47237 g.47237  ORF g.47237 m.47237 type:complete len:547 (-) comp5960_c0_seq2:219-1859(-)
MISRLGRRTMFAGEFQGGATLSILDASGSNPLERWQANGTVRPRIDEVLKCNTFVLEGQNLTRMSIPKDSAKTTLGLTQPCLALAISVPKDAHFSFDVSIRDHGGMARSLLFSTSLRAPKAETLRAQLPLENIPRGSWFVLCVDLAAITASFFGGAVKTIDTLVIGPACTLRSVFTMATCPRENESVVPDSRSASRTHPLPARVITTGQPHEGPITPTSRRRLPGTPQGHDAPASPRTSSARLGSPSRRHLLDGDASASASRKSNPFVRVQSESGEPASETLRGSRAADLSNLNRTRDSLDSSAEPGIFLFTAKPRSPPAKNRNASLGDTASPLRYDSTRYQTDVTIVSPPEFGQSLRPDSAHSRRSSRPATADRPTTADESLPAPALNLKGFAVADDDFLMGDSWRNSAAMSGPILASKAPIFSAAATAARQLQDTHFSTDTLVRPQTAMSTFSEEADDEFPMRGTQGLTPVPEYETGRCSPPVNIPSSGYGLWRRASRSEMLSPTSPADDGDGLSDGEEPVEVMYDPALNCYYDPRTEKYYLLA